MTPNRRHFIKTSLLSTAALTLTTQNSSAAPEAAGVAPAPGGLPQGQIGKLKISRLLLGGNLLTHYTHSRDLRYVYRLAAQYNTREKIFQTMQVAESHGINALVIHTADGVLEMLREYRRRTGGKMQFIICPTAPIVPGLEEYKRQVGRMVDDGVDAIYLWGVRADALVQEQRLDLVAEAVETARRRGVPSGIGAHLIEVVTACEQRQINPDFYIKTFHHQNYPSAKLNFDSSWCADSEAVIQTMKTVKKPWIAFKTMAAGAIPPADAFRHAVQSGADFVLAGMFDFEIAEDVQIMKSLLEGPPVRQRPWYA